jgi:hypothetical protein
MKFLTIISAVLLSVSSLCASSAFADTVEALKVHADYFPDREYAIGLDLDSNHLISRIYFQDERAIKTFYSLGDLSRFTTIFSVAGINLVKIRIAEQSAPDAAVIEMSYTLNYLRGTHLSLFFDVRYNEHIAQYEISDARTNRVIHEADVQTRMSAFLPIGIRGISTQ